MAILVFRALDRRSARWTQCEGLDNPRPDNALCECVIWPNHMCSALANVSLGAQAAGMTVSTGTEPMEGVETSKGAAEGAEAGIPEAALDAIMAKAQEYVKAVTRCHYGLMEGMD